MGVCMCQNLPSLFKIIVNDETVIKKDQMSTLIYPNKEDD